jgi:multiple sugar transport system substrate-binding protein
VELEMKRNLTILMIIVLAFAMILSACGSNNENAANKENKSTNTTEPAVVTPEETPEPPKELAGTLEIWTFDDGGTKVLADAFMALNPNVKINITNPGWNELPQNLQTTIAAGSGAPDVAYIEGGMFGRFVNAEGLEDLLQPQYDAGRYKSNFPEGNWNRWLSLDGTKLIGMPWDMPPQVTFYRPDLIEAAGYPSDPAALGEFLQNPDNVFELAQALQAQGVFAFEFNNTPIDLLTSNAGFFDRDLNYLRNTDTFAQHLDMVKKVKQLGLGMEQSAVWSDEGKALTSTGKIAMLFYGPWYSGQLEGLGDDQLGKWKVTTLPFGLYAGQGGSTMVIPSQGKNKELAWAFVEWSLASMEGNEAWIGNGGNPGFMPAWDSPKFLETRYKLLGDQPANVMYVELMKKINESWVPWPFNDAANTIWGEKLKEAVEKNMDSKAALQQIQEDITKAVKVDMDKVKTQLGIQ